MTANVTAARWEFRVYAVLHITEGRQVVLGRLMARTAERAVFAASHLSGIPPAQLDTVDVTDEVLGPVRRSEE